MNAPVHSSLLKEIFCNVTIKAKNGLYGPNLPGYNNCSRVELQRQQHSVSDWLNFFSLRSEVPDPNTFHDRNWSELISIDGNWLQLIGIDWNWSALIRVDWYGSELIRMNSNQTFLVILPKCVPTLINRFYNLGT